jgi:F-type H+-transporting ATPase subunit b
MFELNLTLPIFVLMFILFIGALNGLVLKPVGAIIERRQEKIKTDIDAGSTARAKAGEIVKEYESRMRETRIAAQTIVNDVLSAAQIDRQAQLKRIHDEGQARVQAAKDAIAKERTALIVDLAEDERGLVATIVKKLLGDSATVSFDLDKARQVLMEEAS